MMMVASTFFFCAKHDKYLWINGRWLIVSSPKIAEPDIATSLDCFYLSLAMHRGNTFILMYLGVNCHGARASVDQDNGS